MSKIIKKSVEIQNRRGLHARASAQVVKLAETFEADTYVRFQDMRVSAKSIMGLLMLGAGQGSLLVIEAEGKDANEAILYIVELIDNKFGEG